MYTDIRHHAYKLALITNQCNVAKHQVEISPEYSWIIQSSARSGTFYSFMSSGTPQSEQKPRTLNWRLGSLFKAFHTIDFSFLSFQSQDLTCCFQAFRLAVGIDSLFILPCWFAYHKDTFIRCQREFHTGSKAVVLALHPELSVGLMSCSAEWWLKTVEPQGCWGALSLMDWMEMVLTLLRE